MPRATSSTGSSSLFATAPAYCGGTLRVIVDVTDTSAAGEENLRPGDVIVEVAQEEVNSPPEVTAKVNEAKQDDKRSVLLLIDRQGDLRFVALRFVEG